MNNIQELEKKLTYLYNLINEEGGIIDFIWCSEELFYPYYLHFNDENLRNSAGSLIPFLGLLMEWYDGSGFPFGIGNEIYDGYEFDKYMDCFLNNSEVIESRFPNIFFSIVKTLKALFNSNDLFEIFTNIKDDKLITYVNTIQDLNIENSTDIYKRAFEEAGVILDYL